MPSSTQCALQATENCNGRNLRTYFEGTPHELTLCRQCGSKNGVRMVVNSALDGGDVESMFKDIMLTLAHERRLQDAENQE